MENNYQLEERTAKFAENIIKFVKKIPKTIENIPIITQLITQLTKSGTSVAANYYEATEGESKKDFAHKIGIAKKEAKETKLWLRLVVASEPKLAEEARILYKETQEFILIFSKARKTCNDK